jgi:muconate cycloisomerase
MARIERIETFIVDLPTVRQHVLSMATMKTQTALILRVTDADGATGWGEGTTIGGLSYGEESVEGMKLAVDTFFAPVLLGMDAERIGAAMARLGAAVQGNVTAKCAVETALQDLQARRLGVSVADLFGGRVRDRLPCAWTLASGVSATDAAEAVEMLDRGRHAIFKLKIGKLPVAEDAAHVAAIKRAVGDRASVRVDVNQAWSVTDAKRALPMLADAGCDLVEQPVHKRHLSSLARLTADFPVAIMADAARHGPRDRRRPEGAREGDRGRPPDIRQVAPPVAHRRGLRERLDLRRARQRRTARHPDRPAAVSVHGDRGDAALPPSVVRPRRRPVKNPREREPWKPKPSTPWSSASPRPPPAARPTRG